MTLPQPLAPLHDLMLNLRWSWHPRTVELFESIDPAGWAASGGDPVAMLSSMRPGQLADLASDEDFLRRLHEAVADLRGYTSEPRWYQSGGAGATEVLPGAIAYFSPEYGITAVLPQYSGGLGILAGDHLKSASDLGVPVIGVGLLYRHGYFTQSLSVDGWQAERYPADDPNGLPLTLLRAAASGGTAPPGGGEPVHVSVALAGGKQLTAQVWLAQVGRVPLLLLDSYVEENDPALHEVTDRLYGGGSEHRLRQEMLLGIGGVRAVRAFCEITGHPEPEVFHINEGHAASWRSSASGGTWPPGSTSPRRSSRDDGQGVHHAHAGAGGDRRLHARAPVEVLRRVRRRARSSFDEFFDLGAEVGDQPRELFSMAVLAMRLSTHQNAVSRLHAGVSRRALARRDAGPAPLRGPDPADHQRRPRRRRWTAREIAATGVLERPEDVDRSELWRAHEELRGRLVAACRQKLADERRAPRGAARKRSRMRRGRSIRAR